MNKSKQKISIIGAVVYTTIIALGMFDSYYIRGISYDNPKIMNTLWIVEILASLLVIFLPLNIFRGKKLVLSK